MTIDRPMYSNRDEAARSIDFKPGVDVNAALDRGLKSAAENIEAQTHRRFYPRDGTIYADWPNQGGAGGGQYADPWRWWFDQFDCTVLTQLATGGVTIPLNQVFLEPVNHPMEGRNWYTYLELDRSSNAAFGGNAQTPQHAIVASGTWGAGADADQAATLTADVGTGDTSLAVSSGADVGAGDLIVLGYGRGTAPFPSAAGTAGAIAPYTGERVIVTGKTTTATGLTQAGAGCTTASNADEALSTTGTGALNVGEVLLLDQEQMLVTGITAGVATVERAWNNTTLAGHSAATVYAYRQLSVLRGQLGTAAVSASLGAAVVKHRVPGLVRDLSIAETVNRVLQEGSGYARTTGSGEAAMPASGAALADLWDEVRTAYGRKARSRAV